MARTLDARLQRVQHIERTDQTNVGIARQQGAHRVGVAGDMKILDLEVAEPPLLLRHQIGQREGRDRAGEIPS